MADVRRGELEMRAAVADGQVVSFTTDRLVGRRLRPADLEFLIALHRDPDVMAGIGGVRTADQNARWLEVNLRHWDDHRFGQWVLAKREQPAAPIGRGGLRWLPVEDERVVEVSYVLAQAVWGRGLATEACRVFIEIAFGYLGLSEVAAIALTGNAASERVMRKCGFTYERTIDTAWGPHVLYRLANPNGPGRSANGAPLQPTQEV